MTATITRSLWSQLAGCEREAVVGRRDDGKRAHEFAALMQREFVGSGRQSGEVIGTVSGLRQRYGLGRWAFREAIGILQMRGQLESRRGVGGGLVLSQPSTQDLAKLMLVHLCLKGACVDQIIEARRTIHRAVVRNLMSDARCRFGPKGLSNVSRPSQSFSYWLAAQTGNRAFDFLMEFVTALYDECASENSIEPVADERPLLDAIRSGNESRARSALDDFLDATERLQAGEKVTFWQMFKCHALRTSTTHASRLAQWLLKEIAQRGDRGSIDLGSEAEIGERHGLDRNIVRQAIRMLEDIGVAVPRRGRLGGLNSREPDFAAVVEVIPPLLYQRRTSSDAVTEAMFLLKLETARLAASRVHKGIASKNVAALVEQLLCTTPTQAHELITMENRLMELAENDVLAACERGLFFCGPVVPPTLTDPALPRTTQSIANTRIIVDAIRAGDVQRAETAFIKKLVDLNTQESSSDRALEAHLAAVLGGVSFALTGT